MSATPETTITVQIPLSRSLLYVDDLEKVAREIGWLAINAAIELESERDSV